MNLQIKVAFALAAVCSVALDGAELKRQTAKEFDDYLVRANARMMDRIQHSFLWVDESEQRVERVRAGEIAVAPVQLKMPIRISDGLVHHWIGAAFVPGVHIRDVITTVRKYDQYPKFYTPTVIEAQLIEQNLSLPHPSDHFILTIVNKSFFSQRALECESTSSYVRLDAFRWYSQSQTVRIQEWAEYGTSQQRKLPAGAGAGYVWSTSTMSRFEERDNGVYVEMEAIVLSRDVPFALRELVDPIIRHVSNSTLVASLDQTRKAVERSAAAEKTAYTVAE